MLEVLFTGEATIRRLREKEAYVKYAMLQGRHQTVLSNLDRTPTLWKAGTSANFGHVHESGVLLIPLDPSEKLISLRIRQDTKGQDYDYNLGEVTFDAVALAESKCIRTFQLYNGQKKACGNVVVSAELSASDVTAFPRLRDAHTSATITKPCILVLKVHEASGLRSPQLGGSRNASVYAEAHVCKAATRKVAGRTDHSKCSGTLRLLKGTYRFPFHFRIDCKAPGSVIPYCQLVPEELENVSFFKYSLKAIVSKKHQVRTEGLERLIAVIPTHPVPCVQLLAPVTKENNKKWAPSLIGSAPSVAVSMKLERATFAPGEKVNLSGSEVRNGSRKDLPVSVVLREYVKTDLALRVNKYPWRQDYVLYKGSCPAGQSMSLNSAAAYIPNAVYPSFLRNLVQPNGEAFNLNWSYALELRVGAAKERCLGKPLSARLPILICAAPPKPDDVRKAQLLQAMQFFRAPVIDTQWDLAKYVDEGGEMTTQSDFTFPENPCDLPEAHRIYIHNASRDVIERCEKSQGIPFMTVSMVDAVAGGQGAYEVRGDYPVEKFR